MDVLLSLLLALLLGLPGAADLTALSPAPPAETAPPTESAPPAETPQADATQEVLSIVDDLFSEGYVTMRCFLFPGTGPTAGFLGPEEDYEQVRTLFAARTWTRQEDPEPDREWTRDDWSMQLISGAQSYHIHASTGSTWILAGETGPYASAWYSSSDTGEDLALALAELWGGPSILYGQTTAPGSIADPAEAANAYTESFRTQYLAGGFITGFELREVELLPDQCAPSERAAFRLSYAVKPVDLGDFCWQYAGYDALKEGWLEFSMEIHLALEEDGKWRCQWYQ